VLAAYGTPAGAATTTTTSPSSHAASSLLSQATTAAEKQTTVHFSVKSSNATEGLTVVGNDGTHSGTEKITLHEGSKSGSVEGRFVDGKVYFKADDFGLQSYLGVKTSLDSRYANHWLSLSSSDAEYASASASMTVKATMSQIEVDAPTLAKGTTQVNGVTVKQIKGTVATSDGETGSQAVLDVAAKGAPLPVEFTESGTVDQHTATGIITFSAWGKPLAVGAPRGAETGATVIGSRTSTGSGSS